MNYSPEVLSRVREPKLAGTLPSDAPDVGTGEAGHLDRGTVARVSIRVDPVTRRIRDARFRVFGCSAAIASASLVAERLADRSVDQPVPSPAEVVAALRLPGEKAYVAALAVEAADRAVADWRRKERDRDH